MKKLENIIKPSKATRSDFENFEMSDMIHTKEEEMIQKIRDVLAKGKDILFLSSSLRHVLFKSSCHKRFEDIEIEDLRISPGLIRLAHQIEITENGETRVLKGMFKGVPI